MNCCHNCELLDARIRAFDKNLPVHKHSWKIQAKLKYFDRYPWKNHAKLNQSFLKTPYLFTWKIYNNKMAKRPMRLYINVHIRRESTTQSNANAIVGFVIEQGFYPQIWYSKLPKIFGTQPENTHRIQRQTQPKIFLGNSLEYPWVPTLNFNPWVSWVPALIFYSWVPWARSTLNMLVIFYWNFWPIYLGYSLTMGTRLKFLS